MFFFFAEGISSENVRESIVFSLLLQSMCKWIQSHCVDNSFFILHNRISVGGCFLSACFFSNEGNETRHFSNPQTKFLHFKISRFFWIWLCQKSTLMITINLEASQISVNFQTNCFYWTFLIETRCCIQIALNFVQFCIYYRNLLWKSLI